jgi:hypothetical protein
MGSSWKRKMKRTLRCVRCGLRGNKPPKMFVVQACICSLHSARKSSSSIDSCTQSRAPHKWDLCIHSPQALKIPRRVVVPGLMERTVIWSIKILLVDSRVLFFYRYRKSKTDILQALTFLQASSLQGNACGARCVCWVSLKIRWTLQGRALDPVYQSGYRRSVSRKNIFKTPS